MPIVFEPIPILARTILGLQEDLLKNKIYTVTPKTQIAIVCNAHGCKNPRTLAKDRRVLICGEFRCWECFVKLVRKQNKDFGVSEAATEEEILALLESYQSPHPEAKPFADNLFQLKKTPRFVPV
jgi:hypothetical protein